ncbi:hypothetical protein L873DRAFT_1892274 [Choiromyces venosus 120613-1]|uniref:Uncharacterized protein n=1 Tax=Choiromyces venosus 120613-1 TaxID=1336337 RepID=A0A3N4ITL6_9PEZI|nr:hypothetical protein L873DRAFT_1892274 [Choiromyces venosus 120613-1]
MEVALSQLLSSKRKSLLWNGFTESEVFQKIFYLAIHIMDGLMRKWHKHSLSKTLVKEVRQHTKHKELIDYFFLMGIAAMSMLYFLSFVYHIT